jgi:hypothetical protein
MTTPTKRCPKCGEVKDRSEFSPGNNKCRPCKSAQASARYWANAEYREQRKAYHRANEKAKRADPVKNAVILARLKEKRATNDEWRERTTSAVNARRRLYLGRHMALTAKKRAKQKGLVCEITAEWAQALWDSKPFCAYCGKLLRSAEAHHAADSATLDRIECAKGYVPGNVVLACWRCNTLKNDASIEELEQLAANVRRVMNTTS